MFQSNIARFGGPRGLFSGANPLTDEQIASVAPSVFAAGAHESRSERFAYIPTFEILSAMRKEGFVPVKAAQGGSRIEGKAGFTKHALRFRREDDIACPKLGAIPEVVLVNAHDGTSSYQLMAGVFRMICLNGLVVRESDAGSLKVPHKGDAVDRVIEGSYEVLDQSRRAIESAQTWAEVPLAPAEQQAMAEAAHVIRFADSEGKVETAIKPEQLLAPRRREDEGNSLWLIHNRVQENVIRGKLSAWGRDANNRPRRTVTRPVRNIDGDLRLNRALWVLSERMAQIKNAA